MGFISANRKQMKLLGYCLDDFVSPDAKCRFVVDLVSLLDLSELINRYSSQGADAYDPAVMLATWFYAYSEGLTSTRKLEVSCTRDLHYIYVSANLQPDHSTLSRFRSDHMDLIGDYFVQIVKLAVQQGLSDFKVICKDGTKIQASCSRKKGKNSDELARYLAAVREDIAQYMDSCALEDNDEAAGEDLQGVRGKLQRLQELEEKLVERQDQLEKRKKQLKKEHQAKHKINLTEPDAPYMNQVNGRQSLPGYNGQASVDSKTHLIVANNVVGDRNDQQQFSSQYESAEANLGADSEREYVCDSGYHSLEQLEYIEEHQVDAIIADPTPDNRSPKAEQPRVEDLLQEGRKLKRSDFLYDPEKDHYRCPAGQRLHDVGRFDINNSKGGIYQSKDCRGCPLGKQCFPKGSKSVRRRIYRDDREVLAEKMKDKLQTEEAKAKLKLRSTSVEPVFGNIKENLGFRRFSLRGLFKVKGEFNLMCIAHNINKLYILMGSVIASLSIYASHLCSKTRITVSKIIKSVTVLLNAISPAYSIGNTYILLKIP